MNSATGRPVSGDDFFDRESELQGLESRVCDSNHVLLTGQRRMGKTSVARELGRRLTARHWVFLFTDVEGADSEEDVIAAIADAFHREVGISQSRFVQGLQHWLKANVEELGTFDFRVKIRAALDPEQWRRHGEHLISDCAAHANPILLVIDELPIFLKRLLRKENGRPRVEVFLSWLRSVFQDPLATSPVLMVSGSIGLTPLVRRLGIPDRINYLEPVRLGPWSRDVSIKCFDHLAKRYRLPIDDGVPDAVYDALGIGIPHHVQSFFIRLRDFAAKQHGERVTVHDVAVVYRTELLGPSGQNDLVHYETRLKDALDAESHTIAMEILAEAATQNVFTADARRRLAQYYSPVDADVHERIVEALEVVVHDGYLTAADDGYRFSSHLLKDWWAARFRGHHTPLADSSPRRAELNQ